MAETGTTNTTTKSDKFAQAVKKATGQEMTVTGADAGLGELKALEVIPLGFGEIAKPFTPDEAAVTMASGKYEWAPRVLQLVEGLLVEGILEGRGEDVEMDQVDPVAKTVSTKIVSTWVLRAPRTGLRASFLTAAQLESKLPPFIGVMVKIFVGPMRESKKGHRYRDYLVGGDKLPDGQQRVFSRPTLALPAGKVIDASAADAEDLGLAAAS